MSIILPGTYDKKCKGCGKQPNMNSDHFWGPDMWHNMQPGCKHESYILCPECFKKPCKEYPELCKCSECGCGEFCS